MTVFVDTSAFYACLDADDRNHGVAVQAWRNLKELGEPPVTTNYVLLETTAVLSRRLGLQAVRDLRAQLIPLLEVRWVDEFIHELALSAMLTAGRRHLSLVDCVSFEVMRRLGVNSAFAFDPHFADQGFHCIP